jgi:hypothetical protein
LILTDRYLPGTISGLGRGLGKGVPVRLGLQDDHPVLADLDPSGRPRNETLAESFGKSLMSGLMCNNTVHKLAHAVAETARGVLIPVLPAFNIGLMAQGLIRGSIQGVADSIEAMGGLASVMQGTASLQTEVLPNKTLPFDDTIGGAAVGFGIGLGGQSTLVLLKLYRDEELQRLLLGQPGSFFASRTNDSGSRSLTHVQHDKRDCWCTAPSAFDSQWLNG